MEERSRRIVETAIELAEQGGFEAVRLRDVAAHAQVALGTLYRRFASKESILIAALELESESLAKRMGKRAIAGDTPGERAASFFARATPALCRRPNLARAILRAVVSGDKEVTKRATAFHQATAQMVTAVLKGDEQDLDPDTAERFSKIAYVLQQVWFAGLVGWMGGIHTQSQVIEQVTTAIDLMLSDERKKK